MDKEKKVEVQETQNLLNYKQETKSKRFEDDEVDDNSDPRCKYKLFASKIFDEEALVKSDEEEKDDEEGDHGFAT